MDTNHFKFSDADVLGVTATACRLDGKGLGGSFQKLIQGPSTPQLIEDGYLAPVRVFSPQVTVTAEGVKLRAGDFIASQLADRFDTPELARDAVAHYKRICPNAKAMVFCCTVNHAEHTAESFNAADIKAACLHGKLKTSERESILQDFADGKIRVLTSCDLISEGTDIPSAEAAILLRPTNSLGLYLQQVGRVLRIATGKRFAVVIDLAGNTWRHGLPDEARDWSLSIGAIAKPENKKPKLTKCPSCDVVLPNAWKVCQNCGLENPKPIDPEPIPIEKPLPVSSDVTVFAEQVGLVDVTDAAICAVNRERRLNPGRCNHDPLTLLENRVRFDLAPYEAKCEERRRLENMQLAVNSKKAQRQAVEAFRKHLVINGFIRLRNPQPPQGVIDNSWERSELRKWWKNESSTLDYRWNDIEREIGRLFDEKFDGWKFFASKTFKQEVEARRRQFTVHDCKRWAGHIWLDDLRYWNDGKLLMWMELDPTQTGNPRLPAVHRNLAVKVRTA